MTYVGWYYCSSYRGDNFAQEFPQPLEDEAHVGADGAHDGVDLVAAAALEEGAAQMAVGFAMADDGLDGGPAPQFSLDLAVHPVTSRRYRFRPVHRACR